VSPVPNGQEGADSAAIKLAKVSPVPNGQEGADSAAIKLSKFIICLIKYHATENAFLTSILDRRHQGGASSALKKDPRYT
jgi:hypothetical protein